MLIKNGVILFPDRLAEERADIAVKDGKIAWMGTGEAPDARETIDAEGLMVSPGFIDTHMHDEEVADGNTVELSLLRQGVTTAFAGNCGNGLLQKDIAPYRSRPWLNLGLLTGHTKLREAVGCLDRYAAANAEQLDEMRRLLRNELEKGSFGLSFGLEYMPNTPISEMEALIEVAQAFKDIWIPVHIRHDGPEAIDALKEIITLSHKWPLRFQISHTGSMLSFGQMELALELIDTAKAKGADLTFDCYPYDAFCARLGSAVFDSGFEARWGKGTESLEIGSGQWRGHWLNEETEGELLFEKLRREAPATLVIAHVIHGDEVELCLAHPECAVASDALLSGGHGHPRAAGTFPRAIRLLRSKGFSYVEAIRKCTLLPASMARIDKGLLALGKDADIVIFDPETLCDAATFRDELLPPIGVKYVIVNGKIAVSNNVHTPEPTGQLILRN